MVAATFSDFMQQVVSGLAAGGIYALLALALVIIHRSTGVINFAQGEMATLSAYIAWALIANHGWSYWPAFIATLALSFGGGVGIHRGDHPPGGARQRPADRDRHDRLARRHQRLRHLAVGRPAEAAPEPVRDRHVRHRRRRRLRTGHRDDRGRARHRARALGPLPVHQGRVGAARCGRQSRGSSPGRRTRHVDARARLGVCRDARRGCRDADSTVRRSRSEHDGARPHLRVRRSRARRDRLARSGPSSAG